MDTEKPDIAKRAVRKSLAVSGKPYFRNVDRRLDIGYRRSESGSAWVARRYLGAGKYETETFPGLTDDNQPADGKTVLDWYQAQKWARKWFAERTVPTAAAGPLTVRQACERYVAYLRAEKKTGDDAEQRLEKYVLPSLGNKAVAALTTEEIEGVKRAMVKTDPEDPEAERRSKDSANRTFTSLRAALNKAFRDTDNNILTDAAWRRVKPFKNVGRSREVALNQKQAQRLVNVTTGAFRNFVTAFLLTGARPPHELEGAKVRDFRADLRILSVTGKTGERDIVLTQDATAFFKRLAAGKAPDDLLLTKDDGTAWGRNHHVRLMREAVAKANLPAGTTAYTMRHTHASLAIKKRINLQFLAENMGTSVAMLERHYSKIIASTRQEWIEDAGLKLRLPRSNVVAIG